MTRKNKSKSNNQVNKALAPEEMALLEDIIATTQQLKSLQGGGETENEEEIEAPENEEIEMAENVITDDEDMGMGEEEGDEDEEDNNEIMKELKAIKGLLTKGQCASKSDDEDADDNEEVEKAETARDTADDRLDPNTMVNDETLGKVAKALNSLTKVQKSLQPKPAKSNITSEVQKAMMPIIQAITPIAKTVAAQGKTIENLLTELGYAQAIENTVKVQKSNDVKLKPVQRLDTAAIGDVFAQLLQAVQKNNGNDQAVNKSMSEEDIRQTNRKNLSEVMNVMLNKNRGVN